jgi:predicted lipoprotein with Yx(FWY)xxD motif
MYPKLGLTAGLAAAAFLLAACGGSGTSAYGLPATPSSGGQNTGAATPPGSASGSPAMATISARTSSLGQILVDGSGRTLYLFEADKGNTSTCYDSCAGVWPPLTSTTAPVAGPGVAQSLLATTTRNDGSQEIVYNGHPLYYFVSDKQPGDARGQGLSSFGADWYVLSPAGTKIDEG